ncbi:MAG: flagellar brake protein [Tumebacillaceae bacterium]
MAYPIIGQSVHIEISEGYFEGRYAARVQDLEKNHIFIDIPLKPGSENPTLLPSGTSIFVRYRSPDGAQCSFFTKVTGREVRNIPLLSIQKPLLSEIHRQQRREFLRVPLFCKLDIVYMDSETKQIITSIAHGQDISGGGIAFRVKKELGVRANDIIGFSFRLPVDGKEYDIVGKARVIRVSQPNESGLKSVSLKYFEIKEPDRQRIVQYTFKKQIQMREKGVLD